MEQSPFYFGKWGDVPIDGDVRPFSIFNPVRSGAGRTNRKHHFISVTYMEGFADDRGRVQVYRAEAPEAPLPKQPRATGYENYYYSQKLPGGGQENHRFEDLWNPIETVWPETVRALQARRLSPALSFNVQGMQTIMRTRVPATRDRIALMLEAKLRSECKVLEEIGKLPPDLERYAGQFDTVPVGINPQETLLAMEDEFQTFGDLCFRLGFEVLHNKTDIPFLTSDNPVCTYDPRKPLLARTPYDHSSDIELIFPLTARMLVLGSNKRQPFGVLSRHRDVTDKHKVRRFNRTIAQFAYRMTVGQDRSSDALICAHARLVPTISTEVRRHNNEIQIVWRHIFGSKPALSQYIDTPKKASRLEAKMASAASSPVSDGS
ncbi:DUF4238 domain-containing protein [Mesorhizobium sp. M1A.F.Ca.IN.022.07.1.1]|uniref:DUF4238 domain-containing protein n=1 Tax=unclassified Mesorhizobium TaxID=325217 RepID=UPI000FCCB89B|nr:MULTISPECIES: DUF4238 domain-containing protein [unclassified Mesorhizobium]RUV98083.1 DUF4238 domain-containing protein [Mesorhizobium sp. M1A.F.Ca.IN.022.07.1.1]RWF86276.1 MAG: DUF4238 domain-containing protein [Mesorhizobium sp.]RWG07117.1 MAG: DUF4238 domain-containing protein [Mesorhizobium sp.]RWH02096.1 MAG: DUF4238 domain-containing protein [Mesorhizobium sp.]RWH30211.1 MAG: DUF4238 domain-containing protein [Mesorhizobium sp.]